MSPASAGFLAFLGAVLCLNALAGRTDRRNTVLLLASYVFYAAWDYRLLFLIGFVTLATHAAGGAVARAEGRRRRLYLGLGIGASLGTLAGFKYLGFFIDGAVGLLGLLGLRASAPTLTLLAPVGLSYYSFQAITYVIEINKGRLEPARLPDYALYLAFFPKLVAGPIERPGAFLAQVRAARRPVTWEAVGSGALLILSGLFKKAAVADLLAAPVARLVAPDIPYSFPVLLLGLYLFALQLYADFSGYTDIARGAGRVLGFELTENFRQPYFSFDIAAFWQRWHISLSTWFRDYLFFPIGRTLLKRFGNRRAGAAMAASHLVTMGLIGLWHGAAPGFVIWGLLHGVYLNVFALAKGKPRRKDAPKGLRFYLGRAAGLVVTFHAVVFTWAFFRDWAPGEMGRYLGRLLAFEGLGEFGAVLPALAAVWGFIFLLDMPALAGRLPARVQPVGRGLVYSAMIVALVLVGAAPAQPFMYVLF
ncbi:MAG: MBOAT family protein [Anaerolineae bacterium]|nr:MBOAT family protein [Anaerolineae bacterium]